MPRKTIITLFAFFSWGFSSSQNISVGEWRELINYNQVKDISYFSNYIAALSENGILLLDAETNEIEGLSKVQGLSDLRISSIEAVGYPLKNKLLVGYENGNLDLLDENLNVTNVADVKRSSTIGDKTVYNIIQISTKTFVLTGIGIIVYDAENKEVIDTYYLSSSENIIPTDMEEFFGKYYITTNKGVYMADVSSENLANPANWSKSIPVGDFNEACVFSEKLFINKKNDASYNTDSIFYHDGTQWQWWPAVTEQEINSFYSDGEELVIAFNGSVDAFNKSLEMKRHLYQIQDIYSPEPKAAIQIGGVFWIADGNLGIVKSAGDWNSEYFKTRAPWTNLNSSLDIYDDKLYITTGGKKGTLWGNAWISEGAQIYDIESDEWLRIHKKEIPEIDTIFDVNNLAVGADGAVFMASLGGGLVKINSNQTFEANFNEKNSGLQKVAGTTWVGVSDVKIDGEGNVWFTNINSSHIFHTITAEGEFISFKTPLDIGQHITGNLMIDANGYKWAELPSNQGILVFNDNGTIADESDDEYKILNSSQGSGALNTNYTQAMAYDKDGSVWVGTNQGVCVIGSPQNIFSGGNYDADKILVNLGGYNEYLLNAESVTCILVDDANRKWIGTAGAGLFLVSADGKEELFHFTTDNSPIFSNEITDLTIHRKTGVLYIGTPNGVLSYRTDATSPFSDFSNLYSFPNPVNKDYHGNITISGTMENTTIKITDVAGNLINQVISNGGQAVWDMKNMNGETVSSGVYLILAASKDASESGVSKVLIFR